MKTNSQWYLYENLGCYFKLENDALLQAPQWDNGSMSEEEAAEVDWDYGVEEEDRPQLLQIVEELKAKD